MSPGGLRLRGRFENCRIRYKVDLRFKASRQGEVGFEMSPRHETYLG